MRDGKPLQRRRCQCVVHLALLLPLLFAGVAYGQQSQLPRLPPAPPAELREVEARLTNLTKDVASTISDRFSFCVADPVADWNEAFNYTSNLEFVDQCLVETRGDLPERLCTPEEVKFYFSSLYDKDGEKNLFLKTNINCNRSSWVQGCDPGWACAIDPGLAPSKSDDNTIPLRSSNCHACCEGFFCPVVLRACSITPNSKNGCGGADMWADIGSTEDVFCPAGYYCPTTTKKVSCSSGHYCRLGSIAEKKCIIKGSCDANEQSESIVILGACLVAALCVLLIIIYNFSGQFLTIRERRKARSRENAIQEARQQLKAHEGWRAAKQLARKHMQGMHGHLSRTFSRRRSFRQQADTDNSSHRVQEAPLIGHAKAQELSDSAVFTAPSTNEITEEMPSVIVDVSDDGEVVATKEKTVPKGKHRSTHTQVFKYAYGEIEKEKFRQQDNKNLTFSGVIAMVKDQQKEITRPLLKVEFRDLTLMLGKKKLLRSITGDLCPGPCDCCHGSLRGRQDHIPQCRHWEVEENLWFSAKCRASEVLWLGLFEKRGISGGQRKRVNVGIEMVMEPSLLILDEPTSGLDSSSSQLLLRALRHEALEGVNVCAVVHQPSYTLYNMFDDLILLAKGGLMVYNGPVKTVEEYFTTLGIHVPDRVNPPDHYIDILEGIVKPESGIIAKHLPVHWMLYNGYEVPGDMQDDLKAIGDQSPQLGPALQCPIQCLIASLVSEMLL
ncbi:hypothetical protein PR202_ga10307 [Eleusine coracana subsp. coracana]|uniref:ABC transporter domain-containing protein n=1 Tax=Eleusine coracana subsp. coracana TaxID=191504 RepID=A0AAV5C6D6_ELECO|nr:hypothetical protein PR202_ga10307 [Eleusine coracana subsp. coracana]